MPKKIRFTKININEYFLLLAITAVLLFCCFFGFYKNAVSKNASDITARLNQQIAKDEASFYNYVGLSVSVSQDPNVILLMQEDNESFEALLETESFLKQHRSLLSEISDIALYSSSRQKIYNSFGAVTSMNDFSDVATAAELQKSALERKQTVINAPDSRINLTSENISYIFSRINNFDDAVIISVSSENTQSIYNPLSSALLQPIIITDENGIVLFANDQFTFGADVAAEKFFNIKSDSDYFLGKYGGENVFFCRAYSDVLKRWYFTVTPNKNILIQSVFNKGFLFAAVCIFIFGFIVLAFFKWLLGMKKAISNHIDIIKNDWNNKTGANIEHKGKLFEYISRHIGEQSDDFRQYLPPGIDGENLGIIHIEISMPENIGEKEFALYRYGINNICSEIFNKYAYCCNIREDYNSLIYIIGNIGAAKYNTVTEVAARECIEQVYAYAEIDLSVYISNIHSFESLHEAYTEIQDIEKYKFMYGSGCVLYNSVLHDKSREKSAHCFDICDNIYNSLLNNGAEEETLFNNLEDMFYDMNISDVLESVQYLTIYLQKSHSTLIKRSVITPSADADIVLANIKNCSDFPQFSSDFKEFCQILRNEREAVVNDKHSVIVNKILKIINEEYTNELICVEYISERTGFSVNHLRKVFKQSEGISISDKISDIRLEAAARLLTETNKKVAEIIKEVGFTNNSYFAVLFKKKYGVNPSVYRRSEK